MEYYTTNSTYGNLSATTSTMELDFMDELLFEGRWLETAANTTTPAAINGSINFFPSPPASTSSSSLRPLIFNNPNYASVNHFLSPTDHHRDENVQEILVGPRSDNLTYHIGSGPFILSSSSSIKERVMFAIGYLKECTKDREVLIQMWVPIKKGGRQFLTTQDQPYSFNPNCKSLENFRRVSSDYECEIADKDNDHEASLMLGRAFMGKLPEWTPDVRYFKRDEYPRVDYAQEYDVKGSLALPVFERSDDQERTCLGVVEIVMTSQRITFRPELEYISQALEAVDLRSFHNFIPPVVKDYDEYYQAALAEIVDILTSVCQTHRLPLALTWAPCTHQGKPGCRHSYSNYTHCLSTIDSACLITDPTTVGFHEACSDHHLFHGQGIVGTSYTTNKPCLAVDITVFNKTEYPLSHHATMFGLHAALAIPLKSTYSSIGAPVDFVLELFLPKDCVDGEERKKILNSLSIVIQQNCRILHVSMDHKEVQEEVECCEKESASWVASMMEAQMKGKGVSVPLDYQSEEPREEFKVTTNWDNNFHGGLISTGHEVFHQDYNGQVLQQSLGVVDKEGGEGGGDSYSYEGPLGGRKAGEKRRTKAEKTISLPVLRQYFAGSLKDAAKSIGVCPTTLKRICRQHGITRWPSRKIKKVGHSLRKLQLVIDSVQGAEGVIQIDSFYKSFPQLSSSTNFPTLNHDLHHHDQTQLNQLQAESALFSHGAPAKSPTSSCSQTSNHYAAANLTAFRGGDGLVSEDPPASFGEHFEILPLLRDSGLNSSDRGAFNVKASFGEEKVRFNLEPSWGFRDLQVEVAKLFNIEDVNAIDIKYVDDDREWVLLTCDADLQECREIYRSSKSHTIKLSLHWPSHPSIGTSSPS